jgi:transposase, IS6 family
VLEALLPGGMAPHDQDASNGIECDHGRLKSRLRPMRGLKQGYSARVIAGHGFVQKVRAWLPRTGGRVPIGRRLTVAVYRLALAIDPELASTP